MINWNESPHWANYHAFDSTGVGYWFKTKPFLANYAWFGVKTKEDPLAIFEQSLYNNYSGENWQLSLTRRLKAQNQ